MPRGGIVLAGLLLGVLSMSGGAPAGAQSAGGEVAVSGSVVPVQGGAAGAGSSSEAADAPGYPWLWPVEGPRRVIAPFRAPAHEYGPGHRGMDVVAEIGSDVFAPADGVVAFRGTVVDRPLLTLDHGGGYVTTWEPLESTLVPGDIVTAGTAIGAVARGGHSVSGSLHVGVRVDDGYANPRPLFGEVPRAVLLPCCEALEP